MPRKLHQALSEDQVRAALCAGRPATLTDGDGLTLTVSPSGYGAWVLRYRQAGRRRELTIGAAATLTLEHARAGAAQLKQRLAQGVDIAATRQATRAGGMPEGSFGAMAHNWFHRTQAGRLQHPELVWRVFDKWINPRLGDLPLEAVSAEHVESCLADIRDGGAPTVANDALRHIRRVLDFATSLGSLRTNPLAGTARRPALSRETPRERSLSLPEVQTLLRCMAREREQLGRENELAIRLLLLLGLRKQELAQARWEELSLEAPRWRIPRERSASGRSMIIPLPPMAVAHLEELQRLAANSEWVLPARRRGARRLGHVGADTLNRALQRLEHGLDHFVLNDLRRTMGDHLAGLGTRPEVVRRCLNLTLPASLGAYQNEDFLGARRAALQHWSRVIDLLDRGDLDHARDLYRLETALKFRAAH